MSVPPDAADRADEPRDASYRFEAAAGQLVGDRYRIVKRLARGGMARVYLARDVRLDRDVAVKILAEPYAGDPEFAARFLAEARAVAALSHPNLVHVYDTGSSGLLRYIVMELLVGYRSLRAILAERGRLPPREAVSVAREVLAGLQAVHDHGLIHCDVKVGNVMVGPGPAKLIDFGIAQAPHAANAEPTSLGSLHAMSPEQLQGAELTPASDLFALGAVLYVALTGRVPFPGDDAGAVLAAEEAGRPAPPSASVPQVPAALDAVVLQALDPDPRRRFVTATAMSRALEVAATGSAARPSDETTQLVVAAVAPARDDLPRRPSRDRRSAAPLLAFLLLATLAAAALGIGLTRERGGAPSGAGTPTPGPTLAPGMVRVPNTIGLSEAEAEATARAAHLDWTIRWQVSDEHPPGVYDQQPQAGEVVESGSRFTMFAYRRSD